MVEFIKYGIDGNSWCKFVRDVIDTVLSHGGYANVLNMELFTFKKKKSKNKVTIKKKWIKSEYCVGTNAVCFLYFVNACTRFRIFDTRFINF